MDEALVTVVEEDEPDAVKVLNRSWNEMSKTQKIPLTARNSLPTGMNCQNVSSVPARPRLNTRTSFIFQKGLQEEGHIDLGSPRPRVLSTSSGSLKRRKTSAFRPPLTRTSSLDPSMEKPTKSSVPTLRRVTRTSSKLISSDSKLMRTGSKGKSSFGRSISNSSTTSNTSTKSESENLYKRKLSSSSSLSSRSALPQFSKRLLTRRTTYSHIHHVPKTKVAVGRKSSNQKKPVRRCSEPFLLDPITLQNKWSNRKQSVAGRGHARRRLSNAGPTLPTSSKQKLQALAKDELLASLNVPLTKHEASLASPDEEVPETPDQTLEEEADEKINKSETERREAKRLLIMDEILETEKNYISCLETLNEVFRNQLEGSNIITDKDLNSLFPSHLNEIKTSHTLFMLELEERMSNESWRGIIGDIFAKMTSAAANLLEIYTAYVNAFPKSISTLSKCTRSSQKFRKFLEDCYENPVVERLDLPSFLLSPVQRLPRYILLLRELLKYTDDEHPDKYFISEAMKEMESLISSLNSSIQNSMEFYSASDSRRKKMTRQFTSKKRKQRASSATAKSAKKLNPANDGTNKTSADPDQGYCSFGEPKDESPEDENNSVLRKPRSATWRGGASKRSMSVISSNAGDDTGVVRRRNASGIAARNTDSRKSWRRSLGAVFSQLWSKDDSISGSSTPKQKSFDPDQGTNTTEPKTTPNHLPGHITDNNDSQINRKTSLAKRKIAIVHTPPADESKALTNPAADDSVDHINNMIRDSSIDDDAVSSPQSVGLPSITSSITSVDESERRNSTESNQSSVSLKAPSSPQHFKRGKLRGSAGPVFKSIFNRNSSKIQKTLSMDELNVSHQTVEEKRLKRFSLRKRHHSSKDHIHMSKSVSKDHIFLTPGSPQEHYLDSSSKDQLSLSSSHSKLQMAGSTKSLNKADAISVSSDEASSTSRMSTQGSFRDDEENNNGPHKQPKEKKNKLFKTLKSIVGKK